jgi:hypothetical protein
MCVCVCVCVFVCVYGEGEYWDLNSGPTTWTTTPPALFCAGFFFFEIGSQELCAQASNCFPSDLCLSSLDILNPLSGQVQQYTAIITARQEVLGKKIKVWGQPQGENLRFYLKNY